MGEPKEMIELSEHVKNKIKSHRISQLSFSSDEFDLSENGMLNEISLIKISVK